MRWKDFKERALTFSYDDGEISDRKLVQLFNKYGFKGTFNLCKGFIGREGCLCEDEVATLFEGAGHEVAIHGACHYSLDEIANALVIDEVLTDRKYFEKLLGHTVTGMAYACGSYSQRVMSLVEACGIQYSRTIKESYDFGIPKRWTEWNATCFHKSEKLAEIIDKFISDRKGDCFHLPPLLLNIWGHSNELEQDNSWNIIDELGEKLGNRSDIWYATNGQICEYCKAFDSLIFSADGCMVKNPSAIDLYISYFGKNYIIPSGQTIDLR